MDEPTTSRDDIRRVLIAGDTHGNTAWVETLTKTAAAQECPVIIQVGDFGYFPSLPQGPRFVGGSFSVDWRHRTHGIDWWAQETTGQSDVERLGAQRLDVLVTHNAPAGLDLADWQLPAEDQIRADGVRSLIASAMEATRPQIVFHGHWHHSHETELSWIDRAETDQAGALNLRSTQVIGLGCDSDSDIDGGWLVLDLDALRVRLPSPESEGLEVK